MDTIKKIIDGLASAIPALALAAVLWGVIVIFKAITGFFHSSYESQVETISSVSTVAEDNSIVTSVVALDLLWLHEKGRGWWSLAQLERFDSSQKDKSNMPGFGIDDLKGNSELPIDGHCLHSYFIYFGYEEIKSRKDIKPDNFPTPSIISIHPVRSSGAPDKALAECHHKNNLSERPDLRNNIKMTMWTDGVLLLHLKQGVQVLAGILDAGKEQCRNTLPRSNPSADGDDGDEGDAGDDCYVPRLDSLLDKVEADNKNGPAELELMRRLTEIDPKRVALIYMTDPQRFGPLSSVIDLDQITLNAQLSEDDKEVIEQQIVNQRSLPFNGTAVPGTNKLKSAIRAGGESVDISQNLSEDHFVMSSVANLEKGRIAEVANNLVLTSSRAKLGAVQVTISTIYIADAEKKRRIFSNREGTYLQRDVTKMTVGSPTNSIYPTDTSIFSKIATLKIERPSIIAMDRASTLNIRYGKEDAWGGNPPNNDENNPGWIAAVTRSIEKSTSDIYEELRPSVTAAAESIIRSRVSAAHENEPVFVEFVDAPSDQMKFEDASRLIDLIRSKIE